MMNPTDSVPLRLCKDCRHCWIRPPTMPQPYRNWELAKCGKTIDLGTGEPKWYCSTHREAPDSWIFRKLIDSSFCGVRGRWFQPKEDSL